VSEAECDGEPVDAAAIPLRDDGRVHRVVIRLGAKKGEAAAIQGSGEHRRRTLTR
jgi:hypothetical protein